MEENRSSAKEKQPKGGKYLKLCIALGVVAALLSGFLIGWFGYSATIDPRLLNLGSMVDMVADNYYKEVGKDDLYDRMYDALELDIFCTHYTPAEYVTLLREGEGYNAGFGLSVSNLDEKARIFSVVGNSPAERSGLAAGMYVLKYGGDENSLAAGTREEFLTFVRGTDSCTLLCGYEEDGSDARLYSIVREEYAASYCLYRDSAGSFRFRGEDRLVLAETGAGLSLLDADTAYIRLDGFDGNADREFLLCLEKMKERGRENLILDLRSDGGGYMSILTQIASHLLKEGNGDSPLVTVARFRDGHEVRYSADGNDFYEYFTDSSKIRVLADEFTASASECLIGAMIDYGTISYADVFLRKEGGIAHSYGKGVMQSAFRTSDGNAMRLTVAEIFWPKGRSIHGTGVTEEDGCTAIEAPVLPSAEDAFLSKLLS